MVKNRFNNLTSKQWLPFQKSWYKFDSITELLIKNILFFTKVDDETNRSPNIFIDADDKVIKQLAKDELLMNRNFITKKNLEKTDKLDFVIFNLLDIPGQKREADKIIHQLLDDISSIQSKIIHRKFILILIKNEFNKGKFIPRAWELAKTLQQYLSLKDEKIGVDLREENLNQEKQKPNYYKTKNDIVYSLYFRKDERSKFDGMSLKHPFSYYNTKQERAKIFNRKFASWQIVKPPPRKKDEILHPAKYPEVLIQSFIEHFTDEGDNVFDPMSGTGSTQVAALKLGRNAFGTELSEFFGKIANDRCKKETEKTSLFEKKDVKFSIKIKDAVKISKKDFQPVDYIITSPPYWDMLNMKGAENQAKRKAKGLLLNYSDSKDDIGNIEDYDQFLNELVRIYFNLFDLLKPGKYFTVIVKNIKKKGSNYPFAWDLSERLSKKYILCPESFWFQDDQSIAPYGYGNTWVSNTFHHYCLTFQKPGSVVK
ncbi:modification methylase DpnIIB [bacterium BMS3Abin03]|nr:modification methylase DpnIIB [bacterium BMS3Abin03]